jgi:oligopeptide/dipeptide ABC transporter ATP-binding protein
MSALIEAEALARHYASPRSWRQVLRGDRPMVRAVDDVDFAIDAGESVGLVGESGSGKTTLARLVLRLALPSSGRIRFAGEDVAAMNRARLRRFRQQAQMVFQNPFDALNPRFSVRRAVAEPLINTGVAREQHAERIAATLRLVQLPDPALYDSFSHQLSGGQLQRVVLARALVVEPAFLLADEPVSMLDVSVRAGVLNLLREVRDRLGLTLLTISHDLALVRTICDRTAVMYRGRIVEDGPTEAVIRAPAHPYTQALVAAAPRPDVDQPRDPLPLLAEGEMPGAGCRFRPRCPYALAVCAVQEPALRTVSPGRRVACHLHTASSS